MTTTLADVLKITAGQMLPALCGALIKGKASLAERNKRVWAGAMMDTLKQMGLPVQIIPPAEAQPLRP